jgi:predicted metal-binding protein
VATIAAPKVPWGHFHVATYHKWVGKQGSGSKVEECRQFFREYGTAAVCHFYTSFDHPEDRHAWSRETNLGLLELEREVFLSGCHKAFLLFMDSCGICRKCTGVRGECKSPKLARPTPEAMAMDVYTTVRQYGFPIQVLKDYSETMNRYAFLMVE